ncbi:DUF262 domain-containing protein [Flavobacterium sp. CBA20B-1]|uniref:DUF262 domain-containing protein n=1 Tax=unclassified Flavobacterium TaxID=196869 RepID=UPI0022254168|nr:MULTISPECIES: DUF262 domain-containing protein [unclassified Flavobacterium]WCM42540.1 DUF262 domain-containing protein [Flavobacterium sp. CBA20B-1]
MSKYLENGVRISLSQLLEDNTICVPKIQRDYVQGRVDENEVRTEFLQALLSYLEDGKPFRDLDFVYGFLNQNNVLYPLDGQQRLTTLMLLHWFLANKEGKFEQYKSLFLIEDKEQLHTKFTYENRLSSKEFYNELFTKALEFNNLLKSEEGKINSLSKSVKNLSWYAPAWDWDPTVQNTLLMLDAMLDVFDCSQEYFDKLVDPKNPIITFLFMDLGKNNLSDDLYIKMNSRGVQLSPFENFKAKLEGFISKTNFKNEYIFEIAGKEKKVDFKTYYTTQLDSRWSNFVWEIMKLNDPYLEHPNYFDRFFSNLFRISFLHSSINLNRNLDITIPVIKTFLTHRKDFSYYDYQELFNINGLNSKIITNESLNELAEFFDILSTVFYSSLDNKFEYYNSFENLLILVKSDHGTRYYHERIMFYAHMEYLKKHRDNFNTNGLNMWMRFISNLSNNTAPYNNEREFINALSFIRETVQYSDNIDEYLSNQSFKDIVGFDSFQYKEEILKRKIEKIDPSWKDNFKNVELHPYLQGQTYFLLMLVGIEFDSLEDLDVTFLNNVQSQYDLNYNIFKVLFTEKGLNQDFSRNGNYLFERTLLSIGDYTISEGSNFSFLIDSDRDISWKRFLKLDKKLEHRLIIKHLFDNLLSYSTDISSGLKKLLDVECNEWWRFLIINNPNILNYFDKGKKRYFRQESNHGFVLLKGEKISGSHAEIESYNFYLSNKFEDEKWNYYSVSGENNDDYPCAYFDFIFDKIPYGFDVRFINSQFNIAIKRRQAGDYSKQLIEFFDSECFQKVSNYYSKEVGTYDECLRYIHINLSGIVDEAN